MTVTNPAARRNALLDAKDLSFQLGLSVSSIYRRRSLGEPLPKALKIGGAVRWTQASVDEWIAEQMENADE